MSIPRCLALLLTTFVLTGCATPVYFANANPDLPFSDAVLIGNTLHVAGHLGLDPATNQAPTDPAVEADLLLDAFEKTLRRADMGFDDLVMVQVFCSDVGLYATFNRAYAARFRAPRPFPARAFIGSGKLLRGCRFEMLGQAVRQ